jgi:urease gamma subunit
VLHQRFAAEIVDAVLELTERASSATPTRAEEHALQISPHEQERLLIHVAADVARRRQERGLLLNYPESVAILSSWVFEAARDGRTVADIMAAGREVLRTTDVMEGIAALLDELQVEATFPDGTKLVTLHSPIQSPEAS